MSEKKIKNFAELDFETIKASLKQYLEAQDALTDHNFDGSVLNTLLDVLAYNDQYQAFYANMLYSEAHLTTAQRRSSVVRIARNLGYVTRSVIGSYAEIDVIMTPTNPNATSLLVPEKTSFLSKSEDQTFVFNTDADTVLTTKDGNGDFVGTLQLREGRYQKHVEVLTTDNLGSVTIPNAGVDMSRIRVFIRSDVNTASRIEFDYGYDQVSLEPTDQVYFYEETDSEQYRIFFGDGVISAGVDIGNVVEIEYFISSGVISNGLNTFTPQYAIPAVSSTIVTTKTKSELGADIQPTNQIRDLAPLFFQSQNRAVVREDYRQILLRIFPQAVSATSWGGEDNDPPRIGSVFIGVNLGDPDKILSEKQKGELEDVLRGSFGLLTVKPFVINAFFLRIRPDIAITFNRGNTNITPNQLRALIIAGVTQFSAENIEDFNLNFRLSKFLGTLDGLSGAIESSNVDIKVSQKITDIAQFNKDQYINYGNEIHPGTFRSISLGMFGKPTGYVGDDGNGILNVYYIVNGVDIVLIPSVGTIDYEKGKAVINFSKVTLNDFSVDKDSFVRFDADPVVSDFIVNNNQIAVIAPEDISITITDAKTGQEL